MKYSLESLPELIGERDFQDLCTALDVREGEQVTGKEFAELVRSEVLKAHLKSRQSVSLLHPSGL